MSATLPTIRDVYTIRDKDDAETLVAVLRAKGYLAMADVSGTCHSDELGHYHPSGIVVRLTPDQARKLAGVH